MNTTTLNLTQTNFDNLTSFWTEVSKPYNAFFTEEDFTYCFSDDSPWPNRMWLNQRLSKELITTVKEKFQSLSKPMVLPYIHVAGDNADELFAAQGFNVLFEQIGMSLELGQTFEVDNSHLTLKLVTNQVDAQLWTEMFGKAFNYALPAKFLMTSPEASSFFVAYDQQNQPVGSALLHQTGNIAGIHAIGIIPEARRKGYADVIMRQILNISIEKGLEYATLQASAMGKGLYVKLGFQEDFLMKNYVL